MHWLIKYHTQKWRCRNYAKEVLTCLHGSLQNTLRSDVAAYGTAVGHSLLIMYSWYQWVLHYQFYYYHPAINMLSHSNMVHYIVYGISHQNQTHLLVDIF